MPFTVEDFGDLVAILRQRPEWREELRRLVLSDQLLELPEVVRELAEAQRRTEQRVEELAEAQRRTEQRMEELAEAQRRTEERLAELVQAQRQMAGQIGRLQDWTASLKGRVLELLYRERAAAILGRRLTKVRVLASHDLADFLHQAVAEGRLAPADREEILEADLVVKGRTGEGEEVHLVWEVSFAVGAEDVKRASDRARRLARLVPRAIPVVAGEWVTPEAEYLAERLNVVQITDGKIVWPEP